MRLCFKCKKKEAIKKPNGKIGYCLECNRKIIKEWYKKNKNKRIVDIKEYQKLTNYACEKTSEQRKIRGIKRETRRKYPLKNKKCEYCGLNATEHHHTTYPIQINEFKYICHNCHKKVERRKKIK